MRAAGILPALALGLAILVPAAAAPTPVAAAPNPTPTPTASRTPPKSPTPPATSRTGEDPGDTGDTGDTGDGAGEGNAPVNPSRYQNNDCRNQFAGPAADAGQPWAQSRLQLDRLTPFATGRGVTVAVVDTGVDFRSRQLTSSRAPHAASFVQDEDTPIPPWRDCAPTGHGTLVAGIIAAREMPGAGLRGVAPLASILSVRVAPGPEQGSAAALADGIRYAADNGADVINVSVVTGNEYDPLGRAVRHALDKGVVVVTAAGNTGGNQGNAEQWPAEFAAEKGYEGLIVVGAVDEQGKVADFSTTSVPVSVVAPGTNLTSTAPVSNYQRGQQGTSFAAPFVTGLAALLVEKYHHKLTPVQVKRLIEDTADHPGLDLPDRSYGYGMVNPYEALTQLLPEPETTRRPETGPAIAPLPSLAATDSTPRTVALGVGGGAVALTLLVLAGVTVARRGRARGWRPGPDADAGAGR
ncbi:type VII secretion-associated serine protease mycosin [Actinopolymorpha cephalotaxi]|uniref:Type VII secretion-associated serine protease mycosin n=1 Tax=Actinopolymorpha cephalotaxi TaxID=504797 RepID=A0A1I2U5R2_9ACTN|nr:S8 family serine peptidase [Actinopolymorpha cephalotaxi]NYH86453.1 type VII secretion-associated serine protease mycosin [Actinopolymorpha cephalotaxi]SFG72460.1 type VII secretion-associated serine protease mycosin [Actinopolymorpha cephalotaxi]